jgi:antitoxin component YwqK of YwqJK toxin-antitoxin module
MRLKHNPGWHIFLFLILCLGFQCSSDVKTVEVKDEQGKVKEIYQMNKESGEKSGWYKRFDTSQKLTEEGNYLNGKLHGKRILYDSLGNKEIEERYDGGNFEGIYSSFYPDGSTKLTGSYENNQMEGIWRKYYQNGQLMEEVEMHESNENGPFKEFYENGNIKAEGTYLDGDYEHGLLLLYNENGELDRKMECDHGICHTVWKRED